MQEVTRRRAVAIGLRARLPLLLRVSALLLLASGLIYVGVAYYRNRNYEPFKLRGQAPELSKEVTGIVEGYERRVLDGERLRLLVRASRDITFSDKHHELENIHLESYPPTGDKFDQIDAKRAFYDPANDFISFQGEVNIATRDALQAKTEKLVYNQKTEIAESDVLVNFTRENVSGHSTGVRLDVKNKHLEMHRDVEIIVAPEAQKTPPTTANAKKGSVGLAHPVTIHAAHATFDQAALNLAFMGGATAEQERDLMSGNSLTGTLNANKKLQKLEARGNSYLRSMSEGRAAEVHAADMDFFLDDTQQLQRAVATRDVRAQTLNADSPAQLTGANALEINFQKQGDKSQLSEMHTEGRSVLNMPAPQSHANDPRAASKRLTADFVKLSWRATGRDLEHAEAVGNAELIVEPVQQTAAAERKTLNAPRFDCDFYEGGNLARSFVAIGNVKAVMAPLQPTAEHAARTMTSQKMTVIFTRETQDVERMDAQGEAKFNELDRNGTAANASYTAADETVRLRGDEPTVWDSRARTKAIEIDADLHNDISYGRGKAATTYYSQEQTGGATPFSKVKSPVYVTADRAEFRHVTGIAIYSGNARAWQDDNFVRGDRLTLYRETKRMEADGHVQSAIYQAKSRGTNGNAAIVPVLASADRMFYADTDRLIHYESNVDIKQGTERITSGVADVTLSKETNDLDKTIAQRDVVLTQPGRRGTGDWAQYTAADETVVLKGAPARVEDTEQGTTEGARLTVYLRESRVVADDPRGGPQTGGGRVRSTHKVKKQ